MWANSLRPFRPVRRYSPRCRTYTSTVPGRSGDSAGVPLSSFILLSSRHSTPRARRSSCNTLLRRAGATIAGKLRLLDFHESARRCLPLGGRRRPPLIGSSCRDPHPRPFRCRAGHPSFEIALVLSRIAICRTASAHGATPAQTSCGGDEVEGQSLVEG